MKGKWGFAAAVLSIAAASGAAFAQGGGNGQGGTGGGNAHSAATSGMTYHGDPANSPMARAPGNMMQTMSLNDAGSQSVPPDSAMNAPKTGQ
ncbi:hypothetical protein [Paraburkholderia fungorum]|uniref:Uncharacterized protein n=1 Tax=Paraburkholderia fungorum TaxID=134537 RepID=A0A3R7EQT4_9BURK|nr:hypothetical protein [Paraburkholderia fungorum]RKF40007.1 hypothetical protein BCY88_32770 [Paraburkholderia fungorum]